MFFFRASVAFILSATMIASPVRASRAHRAPANGHRAPARAHRASSSGHRAPARAHRASSSGHRAPTSGHRASTSGHARSTHKAAQTHTSKLHGQQAIDPGRVTAIQQGLIREHYLTGEANGIWDAATVAAMQKYQADQGWQTKLTPDSRALKKLGLGPDYSHAINAKDSSFGEPPQASTIPAGQSYGFAAAAGINR